VREYLEKHYSPEAVKTKDDTIILAIKALLEVVQSGSKSMELALMEKGKPLEFLDPDQIDAYVQQIEKAKGEEAERRKTKK